MAEQQMVVFKLRREEFGVDISAVREIVRMQEITRMPQAPDFLEGIVNLRGVIVPIVDLCKRFAIAGKIDVDESQRRVVVVNLGGKLVGILVDGVNEILHIPDDSVEPPPPVIGGGVHHDYIRGIAKINNRLVIMLDISRLFSIEEQSVLSKAV